LGIVEVLEMLETVVAGGGCEELGRKVCVGEEGEDRY
jgi:hypothetical protein